MSSVRSMNYVHVDDATPFVPNLNSSDHNGNLDIGEFPNRITMFLTASQARKLSQVASQLADMIEDAVNGEHERLAEVDGMCDLGGQPTPYVPPS